MYVNPGGEEAVMLTVISPPLFWVCRCLAAWRAATRRRLFVRSRRSRCIPWRKPAVARPSAGYNAGLAEMVLVGELMKPSAGSGLPGRALWMSGPCPLRWAFSRPG